ncbi:MAG: sugar phosphate isomerase/epimerase [Candidatus Lokiarchaeota archaeon]|nr:sugar phosphate isomerase/epimerase [Candidatus Lokiarchaeota archaeon]
MKLGISSLGYIINCGNNNSYPSLIELVLDSTQKCLIDAEKYDLDVCEIVFEPSIMLSGENKLSLVDLCNSFSIEKQIHAPFIDVSLCSLNSEINNASLKLYIESGRIAKEIRSKIITIHPGFGNILIKSLRKNNIEILDKNIKFLLESTEKMDLTYCLENMPKMLHIFLDVDEIERFFFINNNNNLYMTYDTSHFWTCHGDISKLWKKLSKKIKNIHLVDNFERDSDPHPGLGNGKINFNEIFQLIKEYQYNDSLIIELSNSDDIPKSIEYIRQYF